MRSRRYSDDRDPPRSVPAGDQRPVRRESVGAGGRERVGGRKPVVERQHPHSRGSSEVGGDRPLQSRRPRDVSAAVQVQDDRIVEEVAGDDHLAGHDVVNDPGARGGTHPAEHRTGSNSAAQNDTSGTGRVHVLEDRAQERSGGCAEHCAATTHCRHRSAPVIVLRLAPLEVTDEGVHRAVPHDPLVDHRVHDPAKPSTHPTVSG